MGNNEHFDAGHAEAKGQSASGIILPADKRAAEWEGRGRDTRPVEDTRGSSAGAGVDVGSTARPSATNRDDTFVGSLKFYKEFTGKKPVGMNDSISITHKMGTALATAHAAVSADPAHKGKPALNQIAGHLADAQEHMLAVTAHKNGNTNYAWSRLQDAGKSINKAHSALASVSPAHAEDIRVSHHVPSLGGHASFTPGAELSEITTAPSTFKPTGKAPTRTPARGKMVDIPADAATNLAINKRETRLGVTGTTPVRRDAIKAFGEKIAPTARTRKRDVVGPMPDTKSGYRSPLRDATSPKSKLPLVESLGEAAVQPSKVGDFGGSEKAMPGPGSSFPRPAEKALKNRTRERVQAARNIDIEKATNIPRPSKAQEKARATRVQKPNGGAK